ncbi:hypothetical protein JCGZ_00159 [Jatropha curcas]|uniref:Uncharacterized protein n=1 Tax=Jatropha curcas TaxID=180498 RepID=A0A067LDT4_JATCU|nr:hypothetical protein JCGZ_00159 [Jatropha curcas]
MALIHFGLMSMATASGSGKSFNAFARQKGVVEELGGGGSDGGGREISEIVTANHQSLLYRGLKKPKKERGCTAKEGISNMPPCAAADLIKEEAIDASEAIKFVVVSD